MTKLEKRRVRYLQDPILVRLGGLAANLGRIASFSKNENHREVTDSVFQESKWFIEWTAADLDVYQAGELINLQIQLALWQLQANKKWHDEEWRLTLASNSKKWSERLLEMSGLLEAE
jgi:hypothetical protein